MFEFNRDSEVKKRIIEGSAVYTIDNFYKNPDEIVEYLQSIPPLVWKEKEQPSNNQIEFDDRRHDLWNPDIRAAYEYVCSICGHNMPNEQDANSITTNFTRFKDTSFNNFEDNYWWPHWDSGYNGVVYLNKDDTTSGTNLYENLDPDNEPPNDVPEHYQPWRPKSKYRLIESLEAKYNRLVLFDGYKFPHAMNISNKQYFGETYRMNQVFFYDAPLVEASWCYQESRRTWTCLNKA